MTSTGSSERRSAVRPLSEDGVRIQRATVRDLPLLVRHRHRMWSDIGNRTERVIASGDAEYARWLTARLRTGEVEGYIASAGRSIAGSGCLWWREDQPRPGLRVDDCPYILSMYTERSHRGRGIASRIVRTMVRRARAAGAKRVLLHASLQGRPIYARLGFRRTREMRLELVQIPGTIGPTTGPGRARSPGSAAGAAGRGRRRARSPPRGRSARSRRS